MARSVGLINVGEFVCPPPFSKYLFFKKISLRKNEWNKSVKPIDYFVTKIDDFENN